MAAARVPGEPPARSRPARCRTTADRRRPGRCKRSGPFRGRPAEGEGANQGGGVPLPSPAPPPALTHWRPTGPRPTPAAARQPPRHEYTPEGHAGDNRWQADARRDRGAGGGGAPPPAPPCNTPPPAPPPDLEGHRSDSPPPESRGDAPPPPEGTATRGGGGRAAGPAHRAPQRPQPPAPAGVAADERAHTSAPERRADQALGRRTVAHQKSMEAAPPMTPPTTIAHSGGAEGGFRSYGSPGKRSTGRPFIPPPPRRPRDPDRTRTPGGSAPEGGQRR